MVVFIVIWLAVVILITVVIGFIVGAIEVRQQGKKHLKIPADCPKTVHDFIVDLECPDGTSVRVAVPSDADSYEGRCSRVHDEHGSPVGLNLVCSGHYT